MWEKHCFVFGVYASTAKAPAGQHVDEWKEKKTSSCATRSARGPHNSFSEEPAERKIARRTDRRDYPEGPQDAGRPHYLGLGLRLCPVGPGLGPALPPGLGLVSGLWPNSGDSLGLGHCLGLELGSQVRLADPGACGRDLGVRCYCYLLRNTRDNLRMNLDS